MRFNRLRLVLLSSQEVIDHEICHFAAQLLSSGEVGAKVDPGENSAQGRLFRSRGETPEGALHARHDFRGDAKGKLPISFEERIQDLCARSTNNRVRTRIGGIRCRVTNLWEPAGVSDSVRVVVRVSSPDSGHWPPEIVSVFGVVKGYYTVGYCQVKQGE